MKKLWTMMALALAVSTSIAQNLLAKTITGKVDSVTVYLTGAQLHHSAKVDLKAGKQVVVFEGLSPELNPSSVMLNVSPKNITILSVSTRTNYLKSTGESDRVMQVRDSLNLIGDIQNSLANEQSALNAEKTLLFRDEAIGGTSKGVSIVEIEKAADFYRKRITGINERLTKIQRDVVKYNAIQSRLNAQLNELNAQNNPRTSEVRIELSCPSSVSASMGLNYVVNTAGWAPKYDVRSEKLGEPVKLVYRANVMNGSGLDWEDVHITLSTANPLAGAAMPVLERWTVGDEALLKAGVVHMNEVMVVSGVQANFGGKVQEDKKDIQLRTIEVQELNSEFSIAIPYSVTSDKKPYLVDVTEFTLGATYEYYTAPKVDKDAFLTAKVVGWNKLNLVSGDASVYFGGAYLGPSYINTNSTKDTLVLSLGRDNLTVVNRTQESELNKRQVIGNNEKETFYFNTNIRNNHDKPIKVTLQDQVPVSVSGNVLVDALELDGGTVDESTGFVSWILTIQPGETRNVRMGYSVKTPKGSSVAKSKYRTIAAPSF
jgi:uncharacterized protein (TIGR02231 family)